MLSGYRAADTKELTITTNYAVTLQKLDFQPPVPYDIVIPVGEIESARFHDEILFQEFQQEDGNAWFKKWVISLLKTKK